MRDILIGTLAIMSTILAVIALIAFAFRGDLHPILAGLIGISLIFTLRSLYQEYASKELRR